MNSFKIQYFNTESENYFGVLIFKSGGAKQAPPKLRQWWRPNIFTRFFMKFFSQFDCDTFCGMNKENW